MGKLIWLASYPKSGNTWLRAFLHNYLRNPAEPYQINRLLDLTATENDGAFYRPFDARPAGQYAIADVQRMRPLVHRALTQSFPDYVFVKTHNAAVAVDGVPLQTPDVTAAAIYVVRDPRDVAVSYSHHLGLPIDRVIALMADPAAAVGGDDAHVFEWLGSWSAHVESWGGRREPTRLVLRYEDMHAIPERCFGTAIRFLGGRCGAGPAGEGDRLQQLRRSPGAGAQRRLRRASGDGEQLLPQRPCRAMAHGTEPGAGGADRAPAWPVMARFGYS